MRQTKQYQLNLIEGSDDFSFLPLNENTQRVEDLIGAANTDLTAQISDVNTALKGEITDLDTAVTSRINTAKTGLESKISQNKTALESQISTNKTALEGRIDDVNTDLTGRIDDLDADLTTVDTTLTNRINSVNTAQTTALTTAKTELTTAIQARTQCAVGSYVGTGTSGAEKPSVLNFTFKPMIVVVTPNESATYIPGIILIRGATAHNGITYWESSAAPQPKLVVTWGEKLVQWYTESTAGTPALNQQNQKSKKYVWFALG